MRHRLVISNGTISVTLPSVKNIVYTGTLEGDETIMADGSETTDVIGFRPQITYTYDYVPASDLATLHTLLKGNKYLTCTYLDDSNTEVTAVCKVSYPTPTIFKYKGDVAVWHNVSIVLTSRTVI